MSRINLEDSQLFDPIMMKGLKYGVHIETQGANWTMDRDQAPLAFITLTGAGRTVTLPAAEKGLFFRIRNVSATALTITVNNPAAASVGTIAQNALALIYSDGTNWYLT